MKPTPTGLVLLPIFALTGGKYSTGSEIMDAHRSRWSLIRAWAYDHAILDRVIAILLAPPVMILLLVLWPIALIAQGRPFLYGAQRMKSPSQEFRLWKIRTMRPDDGAGLAVMGGDNMARVTTLGRALRRARLDEIPQIFNVLAGDIRFVGPRPPLRKYVVAYPEIYADVLSAKPGITGLATVMLHKRERRLLGACATAAETDAVYRRACIPIKARLDLLYSRRRSIRLDAWVINRTFVGLLPKRSPAPHSSTPKRREVIELLHPKSAAIAPSSSAEIDSKAA